MTTSPNSKRWAVVAVLFVLSVAPVFGAFEAVTNYSPEIAVPTAWEYASEPGTYFWNGFFVSFGMSCCVWVFRMIRGITGGGREEL